MVLLQAPAPILTVGPVAGAVAGTSRFEPGRDLCSFLQVQSHPVHPQGADAAQETLLAPGTAWERQKAQGSDGITYAVAPGPSSGRRGDC